MKKIIQVYLLLLAIALMFVSCELTGGESTQSSETTAEAVEETLPETTTVETEAEVTEEVTTEATPETTAEVTEEVTEEVTAEVTTVVTVEVTTEVITEVTTEAPAEVTTEVPDDTTSVETEAVTEPPHEHLWSPWVTLAEPLCVKEGEQERSCACGENERKGIKALGHSEVTDAAKPATCTASGLSEGKHCSVCSVVTVEQKTLPATGHKEVTDASKAAKCTESGLAEGKHCSVCSAMTVEQKFLPAAGHKEVTDAAKPATCTESGLTEGKHCSVCAAVTVEQKILPATGHNEVTVKGTPATDSEYGISDKIYCKVCSLVIQDHKKLFPLGFDIASNYSNDYGYNYLGKFEKGELLQRFYRIIDEKMSAFHEDVTTDIDSSMIAAKVNYSEIGLTYDEAISVYMTYRNDHPLYYWSSNSWSYTSSEIMIMVDENYVKGADRAKFNDLIYSSVAEYLNIVENETSVYHITLGLHDAIVNSAEYAYMADGVTPEEAEWAHCIIGILDHGLGVCESYSELFGLLLNYCDINNVIVQGVGNGGNHSWNMVELDNGKWYWYDPTWGEIDWIYGVTHTSFCVTDTQDSTEHIGRWTIPGHIFADMHAAYSCDTFGKDFFHALPEAADTLFNIDDTMLYDTFILDGTKYMVIGYDTVYCGRYWGISGNEPETLTYNGRTYKVIVD